MITLRKACQEDCEIIFGWRNHPDIRKYFFDPRELTYSEHKEWFKQSLAGEERIILLACENDKPVGVVRFDILKTEPKTAEVDIYVMPGRHEKGYGTQILRAGEEWLETNVQVKKLVAKVKEDNEASIRVFKRSGYESRYILYQKELRQSH